jgi:serine/threonine-protein kinase HipA
MTMRSNEEQHFAVRLYGRTIGTLHRKNDYTWLTFEPSYLEDPDRAVLGLRFEEDLHARHAANMRLPPWFSNLLPEGRLREWIGESRGAPIAREMELLAHVGHDLPGAVQVFEADDEARRERETDREVVAVGPRTVAGASWRFSLAGVGLKFSMLAKNDRFTAPAVGEGGDWIIKLPDPDHAAVPINEFVMMTLARAAGIDVPEVRLVDRDQIEALPDEVWPHGERVAYAVRRFDRGVDRAPIHIEDLTQVRGFYPDDKYYGSFETVASIVYRRRDVAALLEFTRRLAFNILISNGDAHLKNWSLIYRDPRIPTLSPAYDLVATSVYRPSGAPEDMGLKFCGAKRFERVTPACFAALERKLGVAASLKDEMALLVQRVLAAWPDASEQLRDHPVMRSRIEASIRSGAQRLLGGNRG